MIIGIPKEIKNNEYRVSITPQNTLTLIERGHNVLLQSTAGIGSGFSDNDYINMGAKIIKNVKDIYSQSEMILKVKEPLKSEYSLYSENQIVFTYFHFASDKDLVNAMIDRKVIAIAYETVEKSDCSLPLLAPMSEIAGKVAAQFAACYLTKPLGGMGKLVSGASGILPTKALIIGCGIAGINSAKVLAGMGAQVYMTDIDNEKITVLSEIFPKNIIILKSCTDIINSLCKEIDILIGAVLISGKRAPIVVTENNVRDMKNHSVIVDISIDQGGCIETSRKTTHAAPVFISHDVIHYCVTNIPGIVPLTSSRALSNATINYIIELADKGYEKAFRDNLALQKGLNIFKGKVVNKSIFL